jgi:hypothetical protein
MGFPGISVNTQVRFDRKALNTSERTLGCSVSAVDALVLVSDRGPSGDVTTIEGNEVRGLLLPALPFGTVCC